MLDSLERRLIIGCCVALLAAFSYGAWRGRQERKVTNANATAEAKHDVAIMEAGKGEVYDQKVKDNLPAEDKSKQELRRIREELAALRNDSPKPTAEPVAPVAAVSNLQPMVDKQRELILAQDAHITLLEGKVMNLTLSRDAWRNSAQASQQEAVQLHAVIAAQQGLIKGALLKGRIQGFAVGLGSGYLTGKLP